MEIPAGPSIDSLSNPWVVALLIVNFDDKDGQQIQSIYPTSCFTEGMLSDIKMLAMPDCLEPGSNHDFLFMFRLRDKRNASEGGGQILNCYVSFRQHPDVCSKRGYFQQSLVLVSRLTFSSLYYNILTRLSGVLEDTPVFEEILQETQSTRLSDSALSTRSIASEQQLTSTTNVDEANASHALQIDIPADSPTSKSLHRKSSSHLPIDLRLLDYVLEVAYSHFQKWPYPVSDTTHALPFYGNIIKFTVPAVPLYTIHPRDYFLNHENKDELLKHGGLGGGVGLYSSINLISVFDDIGLLPHVWTLWELLVTGQDIVVWSPSAAICSAVVTALASMTAPLAFGGDYRPYINPYDSDVKLISNMCKDKNEVTNSILSEGNGEKTPPQSFQDRYCSINEHAELFHDLSSKVSSGEKMKGPIYVRSIASSVSINPTGPSILIGITNPILLRSFSHIRAALLIPNPEQQKISKSSSFKKSNSGGAGIGSASPLRNLVHNNDLSPSPGVGGSFFQSPISYMSSFFTDVDDLSGDMSSSPRLDDSQQNNMNESGKPLQTKKLRSPSNENSNSHNGHYRSRPKQQQVYSALGLPRRPTSTKKSPTFITSPSKPLLKFSTFLKILSISDSIESIYDEWIVAGGTKPGSSKKCGLLCVRGKPIIAPDPEIQGRLDSLTTASFERSRIEHDGILPGNSDRVVIGNMLLREHFRNLTMALMRPFDSYFKLKSLPPRSSPCDPGWILEKISSTSSSNLFCSPAYSNEEGAPSGLEDTLRAIEVFASLEPNEQQLPKCLRSCQWKTLMQLFAHSDHFTCWRDWKRDVILGENT